MGIAAPGPLLPSINDLHGFTKIIMATEIIFMEPQTMELAAHCPLFSSKKLSRVDDGDRFTLHFKGSPETGISKIFSSILLLPFINGRFKVPL